MTPAEFKTQNPIVDVLEHRGVKLIPRGKSFVSKCPFHDDKSPSFSIDPEQGLWNCHAGCGGGDVISLLARFEDTTDAEILKKYVPRDTNGTNGHAAATPPEKPKIEKIYPYLDENGENELYQALRFVPKSFRQRHMGPDGKWIWNMDGVRRVLYRLPEVLMADRVWIVEGEKDAENLAALGYQATCNVGGAGKWLDGYTEALMGKEIVLCGDNDEPGKKHIEMVFNSIAGKVKNSRQIKIPTPSKDVSDYLATFTADDAKRIALESLVAKATVLTRGIDLPIAAVWELEDRYRDHVRNLRANAFDLGNWLPTLGRHVRGLVPGELVTVVAATGVGKTAILQNIARHTGLKTLLFELELPDVLLYERFISVISSHPGIEIERLTNQSLDTGERWGRDSTKLLEHVFVCCESKMTIERLERIIQQSELIIGEKPKVVLLDYVQLMTSSDMKAKRYERMSNIAEELKVLAKGAGVILIIASQVSRSDSESPEVGLHDAKDSGSIENSSGLVLGAWRDKGNLMVKVLKNTKGIPGAVIPCMFVRNSMKIVEIAVTGDLPSNPPYRDD